MRLCEVGHAAPGKIADLLGRGGSPIRRTKDQRATLIGLGLNKTHKVREFEDTPEVRGMIRKAAQIVEVREG